MRKSMLLLLLLMVGCGGSSDGGVLDAPNTLRLEVDGTACAAGILYLTDPFRVELFPSREFLLPWTKSAQVEPGFRIELLASGTCLHSDHTGQQIDQTITARIIWNGRVVTERTATGPFDFGPMLGPSISASADIP